MTGPRPLSKGQQALWFLSQMAPDSAAYNVAIAVRSRSAIDAAILAEAVTILAERHDGLRSRIIAQGGSQVRIIDSAESVRLHVREMLGADEIGMRAAVRDVVAKPFHLASDVPFRAALFRRAEQDAVLLLVTHHIVTDFTSQGLLLQELLEAYGALRSGATPDLPKLRGSFDDYVEQEQRLLSSPRRDELSQYWRAACRDAPLALDLPTDRPRHPVHTFRGATIERWLPQESAAQLRAAARELAVTPFVLLMTAYLSMLYRYTGQGDFLIGCPTTVPPSPQLAGVAGYFVNPVLIRARIEGPVTFRQLLAATQQQVARALAHRDYPFPLVLAELPRPPAPGRSPAPQIAFGMQTAQPGGLLDLVARGETDPSGTPELRCGGLRIAPFDVTQQEGQFDLALELVNTSTSLKAVYRYRTDLFDRSTIELLSGHFTRLLMAAVNDPNQRVSRLPLATDTETRQLRELSAGRAADLPDTRADGLVHAQAAATPDAVAVFGQGFSWTYSELLRRAAAVMSLLRRNGVVAGDRIGACLHRSPHQTAVLLGTMMAGAVHVPLDPQYPADRIRFMAADADLRLALATADTAEQLAGAAHCVVLDDTWPSEPPDADGPQDIGRHQLAAEAPAYMIYTSGSSGRPKGTLIAHRGLTNLALWQRGYFELGPGSVVLRFAPASFDASVWETFMALASGGALYVPQADAVLTGADLAAALRDGGVTHATLPPSVLASIRPSQAPTLTHVIAAGEACPGSLASAWSVGRRFYNAYGPTETTVCTTIHRCSAADAAPPPIGRPLTNVRAYVVDEGLGLVPVGISGELVVGGVSVALGYHRRPALTAERFRPDEFAGDGMLYSTGDLARWRPDGQLEFLGRMDAQVKLRGFRVELGEVESVLREQPGIRDAVVAVRGEDDSRHLVGYVVRHDEQPPPDLDELRRRAARVLPDHMVPLAIVELSGLPLSPNGKIDRSALPAAPAAGRREASVAPRTPLETTLAGIWARVLGLPEVGVHDDFFALGGHSLLAVRLAAEIQQHLGFELPLRLLIERPTVAGLAELLEDPYAVAAPATIVPAPHAWYDPFPLTDVQQAYLLGRGRDFELGGVSAHGYFEIAGRGLSPRGLGDAWNRVIARHSMLRAVFDLEAGQRVLPEVPAYEIRCYQLRAAAAEEIAKHLDTVREEMAHQVLAAHTWPLFDIRVTLLPGGQERLHVSLDGLVADGASMRRVLREWAAFFEDPATDLPELDLAFRDCVLAELELEDSAAYQRSRAYWRERVDSLPAGPALPLAAEPSAIALPRFEQFTAHIDRATWKRLRECAAAAGVSASTALLTGYAECLAAWSRTQHFTINLTTFNRPRLHPRVDEVVGDFTSLTLLEADLRRSACFGQRARQVQAQLWQDLDNRHFGGVRVQRERIRAHPGAGRPAAATPIVFTSTLGWDDVGANEGGWGFEALGELVMASSQTPQVWLDHVVVERRGGLDLIWNLVPELFPPGMAREMFARYVELITQLADNQAWTRELMDLRPASHRDEHEAANATDVAHPRALPLHEMFLMSVNAAPQAPAVVVGGRVLSYADLAARASAVSSRLRELDSRPGELVAVAMGRGWEQIAAVLGVLQAGCAYLPVNVRLPTARRAFLLSDARTRVVLTRTADRHFVEGTGPAVVSVDELGPTEPSPEPGPRATSADLAYVIYTSGSTGQPKGVMISHGAAANTILDVNRRFGITAADRTLAVSELSFDLSVYDIFGLLAAGGAIVVPDDEHDVDPRHWADLIARHGVTVWNSVPALLQLLVEHAESHPGTNLTPLRRVLLSGDWIPVTLPGRVTECCPDAQVISLGGATEGSIWSIFHRVEPADSRLASIPYGKPLANQTFYVLDELLRPRPTWVAGELYIGGAGVALGYWSDESRTAQRFITHPVTGHRLYHTGDLGRYLPGGEIEFLGRDDFQVKINGHRIELGEIESVLLRHPEVRDAVVSAPEVGGRRRLAAHLVTWNERPGPASLHDMLSADPAECAARWQQICAAADEAGRDQALTARVSEFDAFDRAAEQLSTAAIQRTLRRLGVFTVSGASHDLDQVMRAGRVQPRYYRLLGQWLTALADDGTLVRDHGGYRASQPLSDIALGSYWATVESAASWGPSANILVGYLRQAIEQLDALIRGEADPLDLLFEGGDLAVADSLYRNNPVLDLCNETARRAVRAWSAGLAAERPLTVLEIGAGTGGTTASVLPELLGRQVSYAYTDVSVFLLDRARERFAGYDWLRFGHLDVNQPLWQQGYSPREYDLVIAANVLHDAHDLPTSLGWVAELLSPGGLLLLVEGTSNSRLQLVSLGLLEGLSAYRDDRAESNRPLLGEDEWRARLADAGFVRTHTVTGAVAMAGALRQSVILAQAPSCVTKFAAERVRRFLGSQLPDHMVPSTVVRLDKLPLTANGKVDRAGLDALQPSVSASLAPGAATVAPRTAAERIIAEIWQAALGLAKCGVEDSFFSLGGDSLTATRVAARIREAFGVELRVGEIFDAATIAVLAERLAVRRPAQAPGTDSAQWTEGEL